MTPHSQHAWNVEVITRSVEVDFTSLSKGGNMDTMGLEAFVGIREWLLGEMLDELRCR